MSRRREDDLDEEIRSHLDMAVRERIEQGESPEVAQAAARREFGNVGLVKEVTRDMWGWRALDRIVQDVRYGVRLLRRGPAFTLVALTSLTLGIGANTAIFQLINAVRLRPLPVADPATLAHVRIGDMTGARGGFNTRYPAVTFPIWDQLRRTQQAFSGLLAWNRTTFNIAPAGRARWATGIWVNGEFFDVLGVPPAEGRLLSAADDRPGCSARAVVSHAFWRTEFGGRPLAGATLLVDGTPVEIVGASAAGFNGVEVGQAFQVALPLCAQPAILGGEGYLTHGTAWWLVLMGRLKEGWSFEQASAHLATISPAIFAATLPSGYPTANVRHYLNFRLEAAPGASGVSGLREDFSASLWLLLITSALVLLLACVNLANLLLARAAAREREFAIRLGLGASRGRVVRQLLVESSLLAAAGAISGTLVAGLLSRALIALIDPAGESVSLDLRTDVRVLGFTVAAAAATCILFGLVPAMRGTRISVDAVLRASNRGATPDRDRASLRRMLVVVQVGLSVVLLASAFLFARSFRNLRSADAGFSPTDVIVAGIDLGSQLREEPAVRAARSMLLQRIRSVPGVDSAASVHVIPLSGDAWGNNTWLAGASAPAPVNALFNRVSDGYFATMSIPVVAGRDFTEADTFASRPVAIVNETFVKAAGRGGSVLGQRLVIEATPNRPETSYDVVGVVRDAKYLDLRQEPTPGVFLAEGQATDPSERVRFVVRGGIPSSTLTNAITESVREAAPAAVLSFSALETDIRNSLTREWVVATLSACFAVLAAGLAVVGLYGVIAYTVSRRAKEIGVRIALGARYSDILRLLLVEAAAVVLCGLIVGIPGAIATARAFSTLLYGLSPTDPFTIGSAAASLTFVALAASYVPARAATRIEPVTALRID